MANKKTEELHPDHEAILRYQQEIAYWEQKYDEANNACDWSARNWASCQLHAKRGNLERLKELVGQEKLKRWKIIF